MRNTVPLYSSSTHTQAGKNTEGGRRKERGGKDIQSEQPRRGKSSAMACAKHIQQFRNTK